MVDEHAVGRLAQSIYACNEFANTALAIVVEAFVDIDAAWWLSHLVDALNMLAWPAKAVGCCTLIDILAIAFCPFKSSWTNALKATVLILTCAYTGAGRWALFTLIDVGALGAIAFKTSSASARPIAILCLNALSLYSTSCAALFARIRR